MEINVIISLLNRKFKEVEIINTILNHHICLKQYINESEYKEISRLEKLCSSNEDINLKLELAYKLEVGKKGKLSLGDINEFLYYMGDEVIAYLGISCFGGNVAEINGMTNPKWRRKGILKKLFQLAVDECKRRKFDDILLITDGNSESGKEFIKAAGGIYKVSEYRMKKSSADINYEQLNDVSLRKASKDDMREIARQNILFFDEKENDSENSNDEADNLEEVEVLENQIIYMIELKGQTIGKIQVEYNDDSAFIFGFGILSECRRNGYGKSALMKLLKIIAEKDIEDVQLDVASENKTALNLYKSCGFEEKSVMDYYQFK